MISNYYLLPEFTPTRLQDLVLWLEPTSFRGNTWHNLAPCYDKNHGTIVGSVGLSTWHPQFSSSPMFYGNDAYVFCGKDTSLDPVDKITIETIVRKQGVTAGNYQRVVYKYKDYELFILNNGYLDLRIQGTDVYKVAWSYIKDYVLYHIVGIIDIQGSNTHMELWVNGEIKDSATYAEIPTTGNFLFIGNRGDKNKPFYGIIPLVRIYKAILTPAEIIHNYTHHPLYYIERGIDPYEFIKRKKFYFL